MDKLFYEDPYIKEFTTDIVDIEEKDGTYHVTKQKPLKIHNIKCFIDWERRQDGMHQHLAQHVLSGCFFY